MRQYRVYDLSGTGPPDFYNGSELILAWRIVDNRNGNAVVSIFEIDHDQNIAAITRTCQSNRSMQSFRFFRSLEYTREDFLVLGAKRGSLPCLHLSFVRR